MRGGMRVSGISFWRMTRIGREVIFPDMCMRAMLSMRCSVHTERQGIDGSPPGEWRAWIRHYTFDQLRVYTCMCMYMYITFPIHDHVSKHPAIRSWDSRVSVGVRRYVENVRFDSFPEDNPSYHHLIISNVIFPTGLVSIEAIESPCADISLKIEFEHINVGFWLHHTSSQMFPTHTSREQTQKYRVIGCGTRSPHTRKAR
jgi:hypothetical protein